LKNPQPRLAHSLPVLCGLALFGALWLAELSTAALTPPFDNVEQLTWAQSLQLGYYKHPPLPTWLLWLPLQLVGRSAWTSYVAGAACTLGSLYLLWRLVARQRGTPHASVMLLGCLCITYCTSRLYYYNHEVVLMLFHTASATLCWRAMTDGRTRWWLGLGLALGLGALAKYQVAVTAACVAVFWWHEGGWRDASRRAGLGLAALAALVVFIPHLQWLRDNDFAPVHYAMASSLGAHLGLQERGWRAADWLAQQLLNRAAPAWLLLAALTAWSTRATPAPAAARCGTGDRFGRLLLVWAGVPLLFMPLTGTLFGARLEMHWGLPFLPFVVPAAMELAGPRVGWHRVAPAAAGLAFALVQALLLAVNWSTSPHGPFFFPPSQERAFDVQALARALQPAARQALGGRICVVSGPPAQAAALALALDDQPMALLAGRHDFSPWLPHVLPRGCGMLELRSAADDIVGWTAVGPEFPRLFWRVVPGSAS
jgi:4-amino-4-deoxy-L-arabinose transferase-like glycosyltransferase